MFQPDNSDQGIWTAVREGSRFFVGDSNVDHALRAVTKLLDEAAIPYCLVGAMGLPLELADELDPSVRGKYRELWSAAQGADPG